jgi:hypothetical protein
MNARLYDAALGRFLSPDPYIQDMTNSQNYNRYSYCLNNPLKYTDPSGDKYTYNWWTGEYRDEFGEWASWDDVQSWMNSNSMFANTSDFTSGSGGWDVGEYYHPGYIYYNTQTGQIRYLSPNSFGGALLRTLNPTGNFHTLSDKLNGMDGMNFLVGSASTATTILGKNHKYNELWHQTKTRGISTSLNKGKWKNPGAKHWRNVQTKPFQGVRNVGKGLSAVGGALVVADVAMSGELKWSHVINGGMAAVSWTGVGSLVAGAWFVADFGTLCVNYLLGNGAVGLGDMIDGWANGPIIDMYEGIY